MRACQRRYLELAKVDRKTLRQVTTPCMDDQQLNPEDFIVKGKLEAVASIIVFKVLCMASIDRPDVLLTDNDLAQNVTKSNVACDRRLHRHISYMEHPRGWAKCVSLVTTRMYAR